MNSNEIDKLLKTRFGGAVNIRGIRYQILYSIFKSFDLFNESNKTTSIQLEGLEDLDFRGLNFNNEYIQVKTSEKSWSWYKLKEPLSNFIEVYRENPQSNFTLIVNFELKTDLEKLANLKNLFPKDRKDLEKKFQEICLEAGGTKNEASDIIEKINIYSFSENIILSELNNIVIEKFDLGSEISEIYILVLIGKFLEWAKDRKIIYIQDLEIIKNDVGEALSRENDFQAFGRGLINKIQWKSDENPNDYFEGKRTRAGHIYSNLDVYREKWIEMIDQAINNSKVCILRSSSGQGKSSLMYRYAFDKWSEKNIYSLQVAENPEQAEKICNYLSYRAKLGLPILLIIDNVGLKTKYWHIVTNKCVSLGIYVLITIRNEDWFRFSDESLYNFEILEPKLDLEEAINIFNLFLKKNKIHKSVLSPEWAYERIGEPHLLIEYVYLITYGKMLEERLKEQVKQFYHQGEDKAKIEILRRSSLAHALGVPLIAKKLLKDISLRDDPQQVLKSIIDEYITIEDGLISGLHWVRSNHLVELLHDTFPEPTITALSLINSISPEYISLFISNSLSRKDINKEEFLEGLIEKTKNLTLKEINKIINGIYEAGERQFFQENIQIFDEAYKLFGKEGVFMLSKQLYPIIKSNFNNKLIEIIEDERADNFRLLKELSEKYINVNRGLDFVANFLKNIVHYLQLNQIKNDLENIGELLDWCFLSNVKIPLLETISEELITIDVFNLSLNSFCKFTQGLYRYDEKSYLKWYNLHTENIHGYLKLHLNCINLELKNNILSFEFIYTENEEIHEKSINILDNFRSAIPFCDKYCSQAFYPIIKPSIDNTSKEMSKEGLHFLTDREKNNVWDETTKKHYMPDSYYTYQKNWYEFRVIFLKFAKEFSNFFECILTGKKFNSIDNEIIDKAGHSFKKIQETPTQTPKNVSNLMKDFPERWKTHLNNFFTQLLNFMIDNSKTNDKRLSIHNLNDTIKLLPEVHIAFSELFKISPDYFNLKSLNKEELKIYQVLAELFDTWANNPPKIKLNNIMTYIKSQKERKNKNIISKIKISLEYLKEEGINIIYPYEIYLDFPLKYLTFAFSVNDPFNYQEELLKVVKAIYNIMDYADFFYLIPFYKGNRFNKNGYCFSKNTISELVENKVTTFWEAMLPIEIPESSLKTIPEIPLIFIPEMDYQIQITSLSILFEFIVEKINFISYLKNKENRFEKELYLKHKENLILQIKDLINAISETKKIIPQNYFKEVITSIEWEKLENLFQNTLEINKEMENNKNFCYQVIFESLEEHYTNNIL